MRTLPALLIGLVGVALPAMVKAQSLAWPVPYIIGGFAPAFLLGRTPLEPRTVLAIDLKLSLPVRFGGDGFFDNEDRISPVLLPELGLAYFNDGRALFQLGLGVGFGDYAWGFATYQPRFLVGKADTLAAVGVRHGFGARFFYNAFHVEVAHQALYVTSGVWQHDILLMFSVVDPLNLLIHSIYRSAALH